MGILFLVVFLTILISFLCSLFEATLYSTRMGALESAKSKGEHKKRATGMIHMKREIGVPLSAILILNTIANTAGATFAGMYAHEVFGSVLVPAFSILFTLAILFLAEIMPKTLGAVYWRSLWPFVVWPLEMMRYLLYPAIVVTRKFAELLTRDKSPKAIYEEEILGVIRLGAREGEITKTESQMVHSIIDLENKSVREIMTPRNVIFSLEGKVSVGEALQAAGEAGFSRIPVYIGEKENIVGYVKIHDLASADALGKPEEKLLPIVRPMDSVDEDVNCLTLLNTCLRKRNHISIVRDEYGGVSGLVTLEDLLETALGTEIVDESDQVVDLQKLAKRKGPGTTKSKKG